MAKRLGSRVTGFAVYAQTVLNRPVASDAIVRRSDRQESLVHLADEARRRNPLFAEPAHQVTQTSHFLSKHLAVSCALEPSSPSRRSPKSPPLELPIPNSSKDRRSNEAQPIQSRNNPECLSQFRS